MYCMYNTCISMIRHVCTWESKWDLFVRGCKIKKRKKIDLPDRENNLSSSDELKIEIFFAVCVKKGIPVY